MKSVLALLCDITFHSKCYHSTLLSSEQIAKRILHWQADSAELFTNCCFISILFSYFTFIFPNLYNSNSYLVHKHNKIPRYFTFKLYFFNCLTNNKNSDEITAQYRLNHFRLYSSNVFLVYIFFEVIYFLLLHISFFNK